MTLSNAQLAMIERARSVGGGEQGVALSDEACAYLVATIARDLGSSAIPVPSDLPPFFSRVHPSLLVLKGRDFRRDLAELLKNIPDADTYFVCLAKLHKSRLKYQRILETQPIPTMDQVGPRGLLQYGHLGPAALVGLLLWRKWFFDLDNRAGQESGYLFEPIIASAIGGVSAGAGKSPVRRHTDRAKGRQVDCIKDRRAYELKLRVTIAASGQGRWREELDFPKDCLESGFEPVLVVLDPTANTKLSQLIKAFQNAGGETYVGEEAWRHLEGQAGATMTRFLENYVRKPLNDLIASRSDSLPPLQATAFADRIEISVANETLDISRPPGAAEPESADLLAEDVDEEAGGP